MNSHLEWMTRHSVATRLIGVALLACMLCSVASAQEYQIRTNHNTNLREANSLTARIVVTARSGSVLHVVGNANQWLQINRNGSIVWMASWIGHTRVDSVQSPSTDIDNCCFVDRQCNNDQEWTNGYWAFQNGQCPAPGQSQQQTTVQPATSQPSQVDNCCFVDRQCNTDHEWTSGYWAYQKGQCRAAGQSQQQISSQPVTNGGSQVDNCCYVDWHCTNDEDWLRGFYAHQSGQCLYGGVKVVGSPNFVTMADRAFDLLKRHAPHWYTYVISGLNAIEEIPPGQSSGILIDSRVYVQSYDSAHVPTDWDVIDLVGGMAHEACHVHRWDAGLREEGWRNEIQCVQEQLAATEAVDPIDRQSAWLNDLIANIENPEYWWWVD